MYPTPTLWFEIGIAILLGSVFLWTKPEYSLFLYAFSLGFPDFAYPLGTTINIRLDDVLIVLFLARIILWAPAPLSRMQRSIFTWQGIFLAACLLSIGVETAQGMPPGGYDAARMAGCAFIVLVLPLTHAIGKKTSIFPGRTDVRRSGPGDSSSPASRRELIQ